MFYRLSSHLKELRFLQLTLYTMIFLVFEPLLSGLLIINILAQCLILNSLLVSLSASGQKRHYKWGLWSLWGLSILCYLLRTFEAAPALIPLLRCLEITSTIMLFLGCIIATSGFIYRSQRVTLDTIFAAVVVYLFIAFIYAEFYLFIYLWQPGSFPAFSLNSAPQQIFSTESVYFSLVTIATLGYGDVVPKLPLPRMVAAVEAVMGQFYIAILVAWLVGMFISQSLVRTRQQEPPTNHT